MRQTNINRNKFQRDLVSPHLSHHSNEKEIFQKLQKKIYDLSEDHINNSYNNFDASFRKQKIKLCRLKIPESKLQIQQTETSVTDIVSNLIIKMKMDFKKQRLKPESNRNSIALCTEEDIIKYNRNMNINNFSLDASFVYQRNKTEFNKTTNKTQFNKKLNLASLSSRANESLTIDQTLTRENIQSPIQMADKLFNFALSISPQIQTFSNFHIGSSLFIQKIMLIFKFEQPQNEDFVYSFIRERKILKSIQPLVNLLMIDEQTFAVIVDADQGLYFLMDSYQDELDIKDSLIFKAQIHKNPKAKINFKKRIKFQISLIDEQYKFSLYDKDHFLLNRLIVQKIKERLLLTEYCYNIVYIQSESINSKHIRKIFKSILGILNLNHSQIEGEITGKVFLGIQKNLGSGPKKLIAGVYLDKKARMKFENDLRTLYTTVIPFRIDDLIVIRFCPIIIPDSLGKSCFVVDDLYIIELIVLKPLNNFLFGTSSFAYYKWNTSSKQVELMNKQQLQRASKEMLIDEKGFENALVYLKEKENKKRVEILQTKLEERKNFLNN